MPPRSCDRRQGRSLSYMGGGSSYPWSRFMTGCPILILMASLTFLVSSLIFYARLSVQFDG